MKINFAASVLLIAFLAYTANAEAPLISPDPAAQDISASSATIYWNTNFETPTNTVNYGSSLNFGFSAQNATNSTQHHVPLTNLQQNTSYYYNVTSCTDPDNCTSKGPFTFATLAVATNPAPLIDDASISANATNESATISWTTNIDSDSYAYYGNSANYGSSKYAQALVTSHNLLIPNLTANSTYHFIVSSCNNGNCTNSTDKTFTTQANAILQASPSPSPSPTAAATPSPTVSSSQSTQAGTGSCYDTDGGRNFFVAGRAIASNGIGEDVCETPKILAEYVCSDDYTQMGVIRYECPNGCSKGKCLTVAEASANSGNPSNAPSTAQNGAANEKKIGFKTKVSAEFGDSSTKFMYSQYFSQDFDGEIVAVFPFAFSDYNKDLVSISPKPQMVSNDGNGNIRAAWEEAIKGGKTFDVQLFVPQKLDSAVFDKFSAPVLTESGSGEPALTVDTSVIGNQTNTTGSKSTGLTGLAVAKNLDNTDNGWITAILQVFLLAIGIFVVHYFEKDVRQLNTESTSSILEDLESELRRKRR